MSVYVDDARIHYRSMLMCHMFADTREELHEMARQLGLRKQWFQKGSTLEHYDVCLTKRAKAIRLGAQLVNRKWVCDRIREARQKQLFPREVAA